MAMVLPVRFQLTCVCVCVCVCVFDRLDARGYRDGRAYVRARNHNTFGFLIHRTFDRMMWGDPNDYIWTSGTVTLYEYDNDRRVQMWEYGLPPPGQVMCIVAQPKMNNAF
jgi:hypothetical protein